MTTKASNGYACVCAVNLASCIPLCYVTNVTTLHYLSGTFHLVAIAST